MLPPASLREANLVVLAVLLREESLTYNNQKVFSIQIWFGIKVSNLMEISQPSLRNITLIIELTVPPSNIVEFIL
jgi:hypothetical protein